MSFMNNEEADGDDEGVAAFVESLLDECIHQIVSPPPDEVAGDLEQENGGNATNEPVEEEVFAAATSASERANDILSSLYVFVQSDYRCEAEERVNDLLCMFKDLNDKLEGERQKRSSLQDSLSKAVIDAELAECQLKTKEDGFEQKCELFDEKIATLDEKVTRLEAEKEKLVRRGEKHDETYRKTVAKLRSDHDAKLQEFEQRLEAEKNELKRKTDESLMKSVHLETANADLEMRLKQKTDEVEKIQRDVQAAQDRCKSILAEKQKLVTSSTADVAVMGKLKKDLEKLTESLQQSDSKLKWTENKLKMTQTSHAENTLNIEKLKQQIARMETERAMHVEDEENEKTTIERRFETMMEENTEKIDELNQRHSGLQQMFDDQQVALAEAKGSNELLLSENEKLKSLLVESEERLTEAVRIKDEAEYEKQAAIEDKAIALEKYHEQMSYLERLTSSCANLQSQSSLLEDRLKEKSIEIEEISSRANKLESELSQITTDKTTLQHDLDELQERYSIDVAELREQNTDISQRLKDREEQFKIMKRKHVAEKRSLQMELKRRLNEVNATTAARMSRASSQASVNNEVMTNGSGGETASVNDSGGGEDLHRSASLDTQLIDRAAAASSYAPEIRIIDDQGERSQMLIEKVVALQRNLAKKQEKIEFLHEHTQQLTREIQKKTRIIQAYHMCEESGAFVSAERDRMKRQIAGKGGGVMSSIYSERLSDGSKVTLDMALMIGNKLQEVLEDTLLKNIEYKDSLDTLGHEISRLQKDNREMKLLVKGSMIEATSNANFNTR